MASSKSLNSILFDFYSIIDIEMSLINYLRKEYRDNEFQYFDKCKILYHPINDLRTERFYGKEYFFKSLLINDSYIDKYIEILNKFIKENEYDILQNANITIASSLIQGFKSVGDGLIKTHIQCETKAQKEFIEKIFPNIDIEFCKKEDIDTDNYSRFVIGYWKDALRYNIESPKSILISNYRENFTEKDSTLLHGELIISLGDINDIKIISLYKKEID